MTIPMSIGLSCRLYLISRCKPRADRTRQSAVTKLAHGPSPIPPVSLSVIGLARLSQPNDMCLMASKEVVYLCTEGRPWKHIGDGKYERLEYEEAQRMLKRGAVKMRKPYEVERGF